MLLEAQDTGGMMNFYFYILCPECDEFISHDDEGYPDQEETWIYWCPDCDKYYEVYKLTGEHRPEP